MQIFFEKVASVAGLEWHLRKLRKEGSPNSATIRKRGLQLDVTDDARCRLMLLNVQLPLNLMSSVCLGHNCGKR